MGILYVLDNRISQPPTNSPLTYSCGIVGQSLRVVLAQCSLNSASDARKLLDSAAQLGVGEDVVRL